MKTTLPFAGLLALMVFAPSVGLAKSSPFHLSSNVKAAVRQDVKKVTTDVQVSLMGKVTAVNGTNVTVLGNNSSSYTIDASAAKVIRRYGGSMNVADIQVNDQVFVQGVLVGTAIKAKVIEDFSLQARNAVFQGTVQSVSGSSFVLQTNGRGNQTIYLNSTTKFVKNGVSAVQGDVVVGSMVKVDGIWNNTNNNVTASKVHITVKQEQVRLNGMVASMNGSFFTMTGSDGKTYTVNASVATLATSAYYGKDWSNMKVGDRIQVWGKRLMGSTELKATMVIDFSS